MAYPRARVPAVWLGHPLDTRIITAQWDGLKGLPNLFSLGDIVRRPDLASKVRGNLADRFGLTGAVMIDSGGFTISRRAAPDWTVERVAEFYRNLDGDVYVALDLPPSFGDSEAVRREKIEITAQNFRKLRRLVRSRHIMPVIHGRTAEEIRTSIALTIRAGCEGSSVGIGGLVPILQSSASSADACEFVVSAVRMVRAAFPTLRVHAFGAGSPQTMAALMSAGASTVDSISWRHAAAHGAIYLPGTAQRLVRWTRPTKPPRPVIGDSEANFVADCMCPPCSQLSYQQRLASLSTHFSHRAAHNAWVLTRCIPNVRLASRWEHALSSS